MRSSTAAHERLEKFQAGKQQWLQTKQADIRTKLQSDVNEALAQKFMKQTTASRLEMTDAQFDEAKSQAASA